MEMTTIAPYGSWSSPITASTLISDTVRLSEPCLDGDDLYWIESRPQEKGRNAIVKLGLKQRAHTAPIDVLPHPLNARSRVHEYGGGSYCVDRGIVYFVLFDDQRIYRLDTRQAKAIPEPLTAEGKYRYADLCIDHSRNYLLCVREDHHQGAQAVQNDLISIALNEDNKIRVLVTGDDFYSNPRVSPDGTQLSWLSWNHPDMPWDKTQCWLATINAEGLPDKRFCVAGEENESVFQPQWSPDGKLYLVSDRNNWWNLYCYSHGEKSRVTAPAGHLTQVTNLEAEFATPQWAFGMSTYGFIDSKTLLACYTQQGRWHLATIATDTGQVTTIPSELIDISGLHCSDNGATFLGASATQANAVWQWQPTGRGGHEITLINEITLIKSASRRNIDAQWISQPRAISFPTTEDGQAYGFFYPPKNPNFSAPDGEKPPLLVLCHGGPTGATESSLNLKIQYWCSRGFAVLDVNYRGSSGYGRHYREQIQGKWGIVDVDDVCAGAQYLIEGDWVDGERVAIKGSSAGGYTVLAALTFRHTFTAGASHYGIGDLEALARDTHKFEARYLDKLVGPYPQTQARYQARSPIHHIDQLSCPVIFFQGLEDKVVPPNQAKSMVNMLKHKGIPVAYVPFAGEGHGFRQAASIKQALEYELYFYAKLFAFTPADSIEPVVIHHLKD